MRDEINKLNTAIEKVSVHLDEMCEIALENYGEENADIFAVQKMLLNDTGFYSSICMRIENGFTASKAVEAAADEIKAQISSSDDEYFQAKVTDISDIAKRLINVIDGRALTDRSENSALSGVIIADELTVSDILTLDRDRVTEIVFKETSEFSHRAILAKARGFNVSFGTKKESVVSEIAVLAGISRHGFMRTEFLYMNRNSIPSETEQTATYSDFINTDETNFPVIRLFDLGGDKVSNLISSDLSRGVRKALKNGEVLRTQIRSVIKAASQTDKVTGVLVPMVATEAEVIEVKKIIESECESVLKEYTDKNIADIKKNIKYGVMIETPAACIISDKLSGLCDFFMIGLNDLLQYTYGCDRNSKELEEIFNENKDAVLKLIETVKNNAASGNISVSICETLKM